MTNYKYLSESVVLQKLSTKGRVSILVIEKIIVATLKDLMLANLGNYDFKYCFKLTRFSLHTMCSISENLIAGIHLEQYLV